jgi:hypothetical protein
VAESKDFQDGSDTRIPTTPHASGERVRDFPPERALELLRWLVRRSCRTAGVALAEGFVRRREESDPPPPLTQMLRGGQGGEVRLKVYLSMSLLAVKPPYDIAPVPARVWAEALGLPDPERNGARRVNDAIDWLAANDFIRSERRRGTPGAVILLSQLGDGEAYVRPVARGRYVKVPLGMWEEGWIVRLSGTALGLLIVLLDMQSGRSNMQWISPSMARRRYGLSPDTWTKGVKELTSLELLTVSKKPQGDFFDYRRLRNAYWVNEEAVAGFPDTRGRPRRTRPRSAS